MRHTKSKSLKVKRTLFFSIVDIDCSPSFFNFILFKGDRLAEANKKLIKCIYYTINSVCKALSLCVL